MFLYVQLCTFGFLALSSSPCSSSMCRPSSGLLSISVTDGEGAGLTLPWSQLQQPLLPLSESSPPPHSMSADDDEPATERQIHSLVFKKTIYCLVVYLFKENIQVIFELMTLVQSFTNSVRIYLMVYISNIPGSFVFKIDTVHLGLLSAAFLSAHRTENSRCPTPVPRF